MLTDQLLDFKSPKTPYWSGMEEIKEGKIEICFSDKIFLKSTIQFQYNLLREAFWIIRYKADILPFMPPSPHLLIHCIYFPVIGPPC